MRPNEASGDASILIVDDREENRVALSSILSDLQVKIVRAASGREALRRLLAEDFAAILLDVHMPLMDGFETASVIRQRIRSQDTPILFITAYADEMHVARGYALGAVDYILTPVIPEVLRAKIAVFVELHRKTQQVRQQAARLEHRANQLSALAAQLSRAEQDERRRLAQLLHDNLQQLLVAARLRLGQLELDSGTGNAAIASQVDDLLAKSLEASRSLTVQLCPPALYDLGLVAAVQWLGREVAAQHNLTVQLTADEHLEVTADGTRAFVFQAIRELLFNIVKHAGVTEARVSICRLPRDQIRVTVEDDGAGFEPASLEAREPDTASFGLFSIRERVSMMSGSFEVFARPGKGTRICLSVPDQPGNLIERPDGAVAARSVSGPLPGRPGQAVVADKIDVVLVDDHEIMRKGLASLLSRQRNIEVVGEAADGPAAIELARRLHPHVVVMDVSMPGMSGIEATRRIKQCAPEVDVIGLSMHRLEDLAPAMGRAGASSCLSKSGPPEALITEIRNSIARHQAVLPG